MLFVKYITKNLLKILTIICSLVGIIICLITAKYDGYSHPTKRLLYFTNQSNIWILIIMILSLLPHFKSNKYNQYSLFVARYVFTISIILTGIIFCTFLGPFADESYHAWSISGHLTHVVVPMLSVLDFFTQNTRFFINKKVAFYCYLPPLIYLIITSILFFFNIDFGRGENFPYFFFNYFSPAKIFGFSSISPYFMGTFYWFIILFIMLFLFAFLFAKINNKIYLKRYKTTQIHG